jgi:hypothetical protein
MSVTAADTKPGSGTSTRNGPELTCFICRHTIPRDVTVVRLYAEQAQPWILDAIQHRYSWCHQRDYRPASVCEPCWDAAAPTRTIVIGCTPRCTPYLVRPTEKWVLTISTRSPHPEIGHDDCRHCGRRVLLDMSRRQFCSCSKRCQVYVSQARSQRRQPEPPLEERTCPRCRREFKPRTDDHEYCSGACRQAAYRARRKR